MPLILPANTLAPSEFDVANSCRFNDGDDAALSKTMVAGDVDKWTLSMWIKRGNLGSNQCLARGGDDHAIYLKSTDAIEFYSHDGSSYVGRLITNRVFRDCSAWYHLVFVWDTGNATAGNRMRLYVNGTEETSFATDTNPAEDANGQFNVADDTLFIGRYATSDDFDGYMAEVVFSDGQAYAASDFGEFDEDSPTIWKPKKVSGLTFGNNGFYLDFEASDNLGNDANGGTDLTEANLDATDQATDTPTNNFATLNPLVPSGGGFTPQSSSILSQGNCFFETDNSSSNWGLAVSTIGVTDGKWYFECKATDAGDAQIGALGTGSTTTATYFGSVANSYGYYAADGKSTTGGTGSTYGDSYTDDDIIGVYLDLDNNKIYWAKNGTVQNSGTGVDITAASSVDLGAYFVGVGTWASSGNGDFQCNFGGCPSFALSSAVADDDGYGQFEYDPTAGTFDSASKKFYALCTKNLAEYG